VGSGSSLEHPTAAVIKAAMSTTAEKRLNNFIHDLPNLFCLLSLFENPTRSDFKLNSDLAAGPSPPVSQM
jgi:hypothetical protein